MQLAVDPVPERAQVGVLGGPEVQLVEPVVVPIQVMVLVGPNTVTVQLVVEQTTVLKTPCPLLLQATVPVGVNGVPSDVSVTVAMQFVKPP